MLDGRLPTCRDPERTQPSEQPRAATTLPALGPNAERRTGLATGRDERDMDGPEAHMGARHVLILPDPNDDDDDDDGRVAEHDPARHVIVGDRRPVVVDRPLPPDRAEPLPLTVVGPAFTTPSACGAVRRIHASQARRRTTTIRLRCLRQGD